MCTRPPITSNFDALDRLTGQSTYQGHTGWSHDAKGKKLKGPCSNLPARKGQ